MPAGGEAWTCKLGNSEWPGVSAHTGPGKLSIAPTQVWQQGGCSMCTPLVTETGKIITAGGKEPPSYFGFGFNVVEGSVTEGAWASQPFPVPLDSIIGTGALVKDNFYAATEKGLCVCMSLSDGTVRWSSNFAGCCGQDSWAMAANDQVVIVQGSLTAPSDLNTLPPSDHVFALNAKDGKVKWKFKPFAWLQNFQPSIAGDLLVFTDMCGGVYCLKLADGTAKWQLKGDGSMVSKTSGGACVWKGTVFQSLNLKAKKAWNAPCGGKGSIRAYDLQTGERKWESPFEMEAHASPIVVPKGPGGMPAVVVGLGAMIMSYSPMPPGGDHWPGQLVALDPTSGKQLWSFEPEPHTGAFAAGCNNTKQYKVGAWSAAACDADGTIYIGFHSGMLFLLDSATGQKKDSFNFGTGMQGSPVIGPDFVTACGIDWCMRWHSKEKAPGSYLVVKCEAPAKPFAESGEHFHSTRVCSDVERGYLSSWEAGVDLAKPTWCWKYPDRSNGDGCLGSPTIDSQRNIWVGRSHGHVACLRPDGTLRAHIVFAFGLPVFNPVLHREHIILWDNLGVMYCFNMESMALVWMTRHLTRAYMSGAGMTWHEDTILVCGCESCCMNEGEDTLIAVDVADGSLKWKYRLNQEVASYNTFPTVATLPNGRKVTVLCTISGGLYAVHIDDGTEYTQVHLPQSFTTGGPVVGPGAVVYVCHNLPPNQDGMLDQSQCYAYDLATKSTKWTYDMSRPWCIYSAASQIGAVVPKELTEDKSVDIVVVPVGTVVCGFDSDRDNLIKSQGMFRGELVGLDAETGKPKWTYEPPPHRSAYPAGQSPDDKFPPDSWGGLIADNRGVVFAYWQRGFCVAINGSTGQELSRYFLGSPANGTPGIAPGMIVFSCWDRVVCFRNEEVEERWRAEHASDPRAKVPWLALKAPDVEEERGPDRPRGPCPLDYDLPFPTVGEELRRNPSYRGGGVLWKVVGGGSAGGIVVRKGEGLKSAELPRLGTDALVEEVEIKGERLRFWKVRGAGPDSGWISMSFKGTPLVEKQ